MAGQDADLEIDQLDFPDLRLERQQRFPQGEVKSVDHAMAFRDGKFGDLVDADLYDGLADGLVAITALAEADVVFVGLEGIEVFPQLAADQQFKRTVGCLAGIAFVFQFLDAR